LYTTSESFQLEYASNGAGKFLIMKSKFQVMKSIMKIKETPHMKKIAIAVGIVALLTGAVVLAIAQGQHRPGPPPGMGPGGPDMMEHRARALNLTEEQKAQIKAIHDAERAAVEPNEQKFGELHKQLEEATANGQFDEAKVRDLANQQAQLHVNMVVEHERA